MIATLADFENIFARTKAFNAAEGITIDDDALAHGLRRLLAEPALGFVWLVDHGHAVITFGYDLEFGGADAFLTEFWIDVEHRNAGVGTAALEAIIEELRKRDVRALHLQVRADNPAMRLYERAGFVIAPRVTMTRPL